MSQLSLPFSFKDQLPRAKVPISAERIRQAKEEIARQDYKGATQTLRNIREKLERFERRISHKPADQCH